VGLRVRLSILTTGLGEILWMKISVRLPLDRFALPESCMNIQDNREPLLQGLLGN